MTMQDLRQYSSLRAETKRLNRRIKELSLELAEVQPEETARAYSKLYVELDSLRRRVATEELKITELLKNINDAQVRLSLELYCIDGLNWNEVAGKIGGGNTEDSCRKYVERYIQKLSDMS